MTATVAAVAACGSKKPGSVAEDGSVTVKHVFGETKCPAPPNRGERRLHRTGRPAGRRRRADRGDQLVGGTSRSACGHGRCPSSAARSRRCSISPTGSRSTGSPRCSPTSSSPPTPGVDQDTYTKLSAIAPTIAQSGQDAFFEPWKDQAAAIGQAVFKFDEMAPRQGRRGQVHRGRQEQPAVRRQEGAAAGGHGRRRAVWCHPPAGAPTSSPRWASSSPTHRRHARYAP